MLAKFLLTLLIPQLVLQAAPSIKGAAIERGEFGKNNSYSIEPIILSPSAIAIDAKSGKVLYKKDPTKVRTIASLTKLITVYLYLKKTNNNLDTLITMQKNDEQGGAARHMYRGEIGRAIDVLHIALMASDNNAAYALARVSGFEKTFAKETEVLTKKLGLVSTYFVEPTGLDSKNVSNALEMAELGRLIFKEPIIKEITQKKTYLFKPQNSYTARTIFSTNELLQTNFFKINAGKTGFTPAAQYSLIIDAVSFDGREIIVVVLGAESSEQRFQDAKTLAWWVFENFE